MSRDDLSPKQMDDAIERAEANDRYVANFIAQNPAAYAAEKFNARRREIIDVYKNGQWYTLLVKGRSFIENGTAYFNAHPSYDTSAQMKLHRFALEVHWDHSVRIVGFEKHTMIY